MVIHEPSPLVSAVATSLRQGIQSGKYPAGRALPSERAMAEEFSVSRIQVRHAITMLAAEGVLTIKARCRPVVSDNRPTARRNGVVKDHISAWIWPARAEYASSQIFRGIQKGLRGVDLRLMVGNVSDGTWEAQLHSEGEFLEELARDPGAKGAIIWYLGGESHRNLLNLVRETGVPMVFIDREAPEGIEADHVGTDNFGAAKDAVRHLVRQGHRRIACIANMDYASSVMQRIDGWQSALEEAGVPAESQNLARIEVSETETRAEATERTIRELLAGENAPSAVFCINDYIAFDVLESLSALKLSVPADVSIVGFDGLLRWIPGGGNVTTANQDFERMGEMAVKLLLERFENPTRNAFKHIYLSAPIVEHGSTQAISIQDALEAGTR